jgi:hypothetical protein
VTVSTIVQKKKHLRKEKVQRQKSINRIPLRHSQTDEIYHAHNAFSSIERFIKLDAFFFDQIVRRFDHIFVDIIERIEEEKNTFIE